jgi:hypothetical protein
VVEDTDLDALLDVCAALDVWGDWGDWGGAEDELGCGAAEVGLTAVVPGAVAASAACDPCFVVEVRARAAMTATTTRNAAATDIGSHLLPRLLPECVAFTLRPFVCPVTLRRT